MTETPESGTEPAAVGTERRDQPNRLSQVTAWVGIVAGVVFVLAVIFFSGVYAGTQFSGGESGPHDHHGESSAGIDDHRGEGAPGDDDHRGEGAPGDDDHRGEGSPGPGEVGQQPSTSAGPTTPSSPHP